MLKGLFGKGKKKNCGEVMSNAFKKLKAGTLSDEELNEALKVSRNMIKAVRLTI